jgi:hypothetical protein
MNPIADDDEERIEFAEMMVYHKHACAINLLVENHTAKELKAHLTKYLKIEGKDDLDTIRRKEQSRKLLSRTDSRESADSLREPGSPQLEKDSSSVITSASSRASKKRASGSMILLVDNGLQRRPATVLRACCGYNLLSAELLEDWDPDVDLEGVAAMDVEFALLDRGAVPRTLRSSQLVSLSWVSRGGTTMHGNVNFMLVRGLTNADVILGDHGPDGANRAEKTCPRVGQCL